MQQAVQNQLRDFFVKGKVVLRRLPCSLPDCDYDIAQTVRGGGALEIFRLGGKRQHIRHRILTQMFTIKTPYGAVTDEGNRRPTFADLRLYFPFRAVYFY